MGVLAKVDLQPEILTRRIELAAKLATQLKASLNTVVPVSAGTFPTHSALFVGLLVGVIVIVGALTFFPALSLGPVVEHFFMTAGKLWS